MAVYDVELYDGRIVTLESDHEPTEDEILSAVGSYQPPEQPDFLSRDEVSGVPGFSREMVALNPNASPFDYDAAKEDLVASLAQGGIGLQEGFKGLGEQGWSVLQALSEPIVEMGPLSLTPSGFRLTPVARSTAEFSREAAKESQRGSDELQALAQEIGGAPIMRTIGQGIPSVAPALAAGPLGLPAVLASAGAQAGGSTLAKGQDIFEQMPEERGTGLFPNREFWDAAGPAAADALMTAATTAVFGRLFGGGTEAVTLPAKRELIKATVGKRAAEVLGEGLEEGTQQLLSDYVIGRMSYDPDITFDEALKQAVDAGIAGGIIGGGLVGAKTFSEQPAIPEMIRQDRTPTLDINLDPLTDEIPREVQLLTTEQAEAGLAERVQEASDFDIRSMAEPAPRRVARVSQEAAEAGLLEKLPEAPLNADIRGLAEPTTKPEPISSELVVEPKPAEAKVETLTSPEVAPKTGAAGKPAASNLAEGEGGVPYYRKLGEQDALDPKRKKKRAVPQNFKLAYENGWSEGKKQSNLKSPSIPPAEIKVDTPEIQGMGGAVPAEFNKRYQLPGSPQTYTVVERLTQSASEKANNEQPVRVKNERTGKEEVVLESELKEVSATDKPKTAKRTKAQLDKALRDAGMDPAAFPDAKSKKSAIDRAIAKLEETQKKIRGSRSTLYMGVAKLPVDVALTVAIDALKVGKSIKVAFDMAINKLRELVNGPIDEDAIREQWLAELTSTERKETESRFWTGQQESGTRVRQIVQAQQFVEGKSISDVLDSVSLVAGGQAVEGLSQETIPAVLANTITRINNELSSTKNPVEYADVWAQMDRASNLFQQQASEAGRQLESQKIVGEQLSGMAPVLAYRGLAKKAWANALELDSADDPETVIGNVVKGSSKAAGENITVDEVEKRVKPESVSTALNRAIRESGLKLSTLFMDTDHATQAERRKHLFNQIRQKLPNLNSEQRIALEKALSESWEAARLKVFRQQFKKFVGLPEVAVDNIMDAVQPELIRQANLGTLNEESFRNAIAKKLGLPDISGETSRNLIKLAQDAQAAPEGVLRNKILQKMVDTLQANSPASPYDLIRDFWYNNALSGTRTLAAILTGSWIHGAILSSQEAMDAALQGKPKVGGRILQAFLLDSLEGIANGWDVFKTGDYTRRAEYSEQINRLLSGSGRMDSLEGWWKHGNPWQKALGVTTFVRRAVIALDYVGAIATRGSGVIYNALLDSPEQLQAALARFDKQASAQAKKQAQAEMGPKAKWVDIRARQLEILEQGIAKESKEKAKILGEIAALNADPVGWLGAVYKVLESFPRAIQGVTGTSKETAQFASFVSKAAVGLAFARAALNMTQNASNWMPLVGGLNYGRALLGKQLPKGHWARVLAVTDQNGNPLSDDRRRLIAAAQASSMALAAIAYAMTRSGDDDDDKGFDIQGSWHGLTPQQKKDKLAIGERPLSMRVAGRHIRYDNFPFAGTLAVIGNMRDKERKEGKRMDANDAISRIADGWASGIFYMKDLSVISGLSQALGISAMNTDEGADALNRLAAQQSRTAAALIPFSSLVREVDTFFDPSVYTPNKGVDYWVRGIPFVRRTMGEGPAYNMAGLPVENMFTPQSRFLAAKSKRDPVVEALSNLIAKGKFPHHPDPSPTWIKDGERRPAKEYPEETYKFQRDTLVAWRKAMLEDIDFLKEATPEDYEIFYKEVLVPLRNQIKAEIQEKIDLKPKP